jgi:hypothetical protein
MIHRGAGRRVNMLLSTYKNSVSHSMELLGEQHFGSLTSLTWTA